MLSHLTPVQRTNLYYFSQFMAGGAANAYAGIWLSQQGLSDNQVGLIGTVPLMMILAVNVLVGRLADRASDWRQVIVMGAFASALFALPLFGASGFIPILVFFTLTTVAMSLIVPVSDAAGLHLAREQNANFGSMRAFSTLGYISTLFITDFVVMWFGAWVFIPIFIALSFLRFGMSLCLPRFKSEHSNTVASRDHSFFDFFQPWLFLPLAGWAIVYATHMVLNNFQSLLWSEQGFSGGLISTLIAVGAGAEVLAFYLFKNISPKLNLRWLIALSGVVTVLRWLAMSFTPTLLWLVPLQMLHGITYALGFLACVNYIGKAFNKSVAAEAQSFFVVLQQVSAIVVISVFSWVSNDQGGNPFFANAIMASVGCVVMATAYFFKPPAPIALDQSA